jgi:class 3 adenylate cyclase/tetratricopeptide (TPR) repeat protein
MKCPECQFENPEDFYFCGKCGCQLSTSSNLPVTEQSLKTKLKRIQRYLPRALVEKVLSQRDELEGERRQVTIMFCDIKESMSLVEKLGPEKAFSFMNQIFEILIHKTNEYEGTVNEMRGDGILALFGAPYAIENSPQRALQSALAIHWEIARFNEEGGYHRGFPLILLRIGINTGPVVVGSVGNDLRVQFTAVGDTINMAARMEQMAEPGTTYVTEDTFRQTKELFEFKALGKRKVKGKEKPMAVYKVLSGKKGIYRPRLESERTLSSKMVGRDNELNRLALQVMKAVNGKGSVVSIIGEAGIGKSRLITELKKLDVADQVSFIEGRAISIGKNLSYHPIIDFLKQWARISTDDGEATALGKLEHAVRSVCSEDVYEILPFVATLMGMTLSGRYAERIKGIEGEALEKLILMNMRELMIKVTEVNPIVIVAEDLHWADTSSIELLEYLYRLAETQRILFINVFRPGYEETGDRVVKVIREKLQVYNIEIVLTPLGEKTCRSFITRMLNLGDLDQNIIDQIIQRTDGNPYFIEEVVRSLIDEGAVALKGGKFKPTKILSTVTIPYTIIDVLMTRIDRLDAGTRNLLKAASVIGQGFFHRILSEVASTVEDMNERLSYLKKAQLIRERKRMGEVEYLFNHALTQEAAYDSILPIKKRKLHLKVARAIEKVFAERLHEFYGMLAFHYGKAENSGKAEEYLLKAGKEALKTSASNEALHFFKEALNLYLEKNVTAIDTDKIALHEKNIALALYNRGQYDESIDHFNKALAFLGVKMPTSAFSTTFQFLSAFFHLLITLYLPMMKFKKAPTQKDMETINLLNKTCKSLSMVDPKRFFVVALNAVKIISCFNITRFDLGLQMFLSTSALFSFTGISFKMSHKVLKIAKNKVTRADVKSYYTFELVEMVHNYLEGNWNSLKPYDENHVTINLSLGRIFDASQYLYWHGFLSIYQGSFNVTKQIINRLNDIFIDFENDMSVAFKYELNTRLLMESRKLHDALIEIDRGIDFKPKMGLSYFLIEMYSCQALVHIIMNDLEKADQSIARANNIRNEIDTAVPFQLLNIYSSQLMYDLYRLNESIKNGNKADILKYRKNASKSSKGLLKISQKAAQHRTEAYRLAGIYYWIIRKQEKALKCWHKAILEGKRLGARLELSRTYHEVGKRLLEPESKYKFLGGHKPEELLLKAKFHYEKMGLQWDLDKLNPLCERL